MGKQPKAVVLVSGGMDSCVTAAMAAAAGHELAMVHASYGQRTEARERRAFEEIAGFYGVPAEARLVVRLEHLGRMGGSALTDKRIALPENEMPAHSTSGRSRPTPSGRDLSCKDFAAGAQGTSEMAAGAASGQSRPTAPGRDLSYKDFAGAQAGKPVPATYVPFRNAHLLAVAVSWAEVVGAGAVYIGAVAEDSSGYPDCRPEYYRAFQELVRAGTRPETEIEIVTPVIHMRKHEIVRRGIELGAPLHLTWSCYQFEDAACGVCESCRLRLRAFAQAGVPDAVPYRARVER